MLLPIKFIMFEFVVNRVSLAFFWLQIAWKMYALNSTLFRVLVNSWVGRALNTDFIFHTHHEFSVKACKMWFNTPTSISSKVNETMFLLQAQASIASVRQWSLTGAPCSVYDNCELWDTEPSWLTTTLKLFPLTTMSATDSTSTKYPQRYTLNDYLLKFNTHSFKK